MLVATIMNTPLSEHSTKPISAGLRLGTMLLDHALICFIGIPPVIVWQYLTQENGSAAPTSPYLMMPFFVIYFCKDCIGGRSAAKRILKLAVVRNKAGTPATPLQCLIRNLLVIIWPVEVVVASFNQQQRIGDWLAGTKLTYYDSTKKSQLQIIQIVVAIVMATLITYLLIILFERI